MRPALGGSWPRAIANALYTQPKAILFDLVQPFRACRNVLRWDAKASIGRWRIFANPVLGCFLCVTVRITMVVGWRGSALTSIGDESAGIAPSSAPARSR